MNNLPKKQNSFRILVIDDSDVDRLVYMRLLQSQGWEVEGVNNAKAGLQKLRDSNIDLVLCDYLMPEMDGLQFLQKLRLSPELKHHIVIIITSDESRELKLKLLEAGANDFVHKGGVKEELYARIRAHLKSREAFSAKSILELAAMLANELSNPISSAHAALDLLAEKIKKNGAKNFADYEMLLSRVDQSLSEVEKLTSKIRELGMGQDPSSFLKPKLY